MVTQVKGKRKKVKSFEKTKNINEDNLNKNNKHANQYSNFFMNGMHSFYLSFAFMLTE
jgi:hypothetical protein